MKLNHNIGYYLECTLKTRDVVEPVMGANCVLSILNKRLY